MSGETDQASSSAVECLRHTGDRKKEAMAIQSEAGLQLLPDASQARTFDSAPGADRLSTMLQRVSPVEILLACVPGPEELLLLLFRPRPQIRIQSQRAAPSTERYNKTATGTQRRGKQWGGAFGTALGTP